MVEKAPDYKFASVLDLHQSEDAGVLIRSHESVVSFYEPRMAQRELCHDFVKGNHWTDEEREIARQKKKALVEFQKLKTSERAFIGSIVQQRYDVKPAPREPTDQDKSDVYTALYHWTADVTDCRYKDPGLIRDAWAGGNAWQESYVEITPGRKPRIVVDNQNNFAMYPDPNRRDLVHNSDCEFIDRESWMSRSQLCDAVPDKEAEIIAGLPDKTTITYDREDKVYADRSHEWKNYRNGKYKVVERFYKVRKKLFFGVKDGQRIDIGYDATPEARAMFKADYPDHTIHIEREEYLFLAIVVPAMGSVYLYNGPYHCQPRDPVSGRIMFPFVELVDEDLDGEPSGHVAPQIGPIKLLNSLMVNKLYQAKNAAGQSHTVSRDHFEDDVLEDLVENHQDGARTFPKKAGAPQGSGVELIPQGKGSIDADASIDFVNSFIEEVSSTPPALKGQSEGNVAGVLNEQRIQQAFIQNQGFTTNYMGFLARRAKLWKYYWKEYFDAEEVIRVLEKKNPEDPDFITINQIVMDNFGQVARANTLDDADAYDITFEDSWRSPTVRDKVRQQIVQLQANPAVQQDPTLNAFLTYYFLQLSDAPQEMKNLVREHSQVIAQAEAQKAAVEQQNATLDQQLKMQDVADREAQATAMPPGMPAGAGQRPAGPQPQRSAPAPVPMPGRSMQPAAVPA